MPAWFVYLFSTIDMLDWHNLLEVNISMAKVLRVPNLQVGITAKKKKNKNIGCADNMYVTRLSVCSQRM